jgi:hypothetical protein
MLRCARVAEPGLEHYAALVAHELTVRGMSCVRGIGASIRLPGYPADCRPTEPGGRTARSSTSNVIAIASTPSLNASILALPRLARVFGVSRSSDKTPPHARGVGPDGRTRPRRDSERCAHHRRLRNATFAHRPGENRGNQDTNRLRAQCVSGRCGVPRGGAERDADEDRSLATPAYKHQLRYRAREDTTSPAARADARTICVKPSQGLGANIMAPALLGRAPTIARSRGQGISRLGALGFPFPKVLVWGSAGAVPIRRSEDTPAPRSVPRSRDDRPTSGRPTPPLRSRGTGR